MNLIQINTISFPLKIVFEWNEYDKHTQTDEEYNENVDNDEYKDDTI